MLGDSRMIESAIIDRRFSAVTPKPAWAADYIGIPWRDTGRDRSGCDCWGLARLVLWERFGIEVPLYAGVGYETHDNDALAKLIADERDAAWARAWRPILVAEARAGDLILLAMEKRPIHLGLVAAPGWMLHIEEGVDSACEAYDDMKWGRRVAAVYRHEAGR